MRILFLTRYPYEGASSRYRVFQYVPHLEKLGVHCDVQCFMDLEMYELSFAPGYTLRKVGHTVSAVLTRLFALRHWRSYDIIYMQRELFPFGPPLVERLLKALGARLVFDYDDALFIKKPSRFNFVATLLRSPQKTYRLFNIADCVVAGNNYLRNAASGHCQRIVTIEVGEDTSRIKMRQPHDNADGVLIGWLGSKSTVKYLRLIEGVLRDISVAYPFVRFEIVGGGDFSLPGLPVTHTKWSLEAELAALARFDIGLMPLPLEEWSKGKSGGKARTYMAAGVPPVCTHIGYNIELVRHGETGFLCETIDDWRVALAKLVERPELRQQMAEAARRDVICRFSPEGQAKKLHAVFTCLLDGTPIEEHQEFRSSIGSIAS